MTAPKFTPEQGPQFFINFGFNTQGNQKFPEWVVALEGTASKADFDSLMKDLMEYCDSHAPSMGTVQLSSMLCCSCFYLVAKFDSGLNKVLERHSHLTGIAIERIDSPLIVGDIPHEQAVDQYGNGRTTSSAYRGRARPVWPPLGYNVILQVPRARSDEVRAAWGAGAAPDRNPPPPMCHAMSDTQFPRPSRSLLPTDPRNRGGAVPEQLTVPAALVVHPTAVRVKGEAGSGADGASVPAQILRLKALMDAGALTPEEFAAKKRELLGRM